jgi:inorganic triphosphatase YgiF
MWKFYWKVHDHLFELKKWIEDHEKETCKERKKEKIQFDDDLNLLHSRLETDELLGKANKVIISKRKKILQSIRDWYEKHYWTEEDNSELDCKGSKNKREKCLHHYFYHVWEIMEKIKDVDIFWNTDKDKKRKLWKEMEQFPNYVKNGVPKDEK